MSNIVEFPGLNLSLLVNRVAFTIFGIDIYWYAICITIGVVLAVAFAMKQSNRFGIDSDKLLDVVMIAFICALIGGRLYYVVFSGETYNSFFEVIYTRNGGIAIYGAIIAAFASAALVCKWRKVPVLPLFDLAGMGFLIGQSIGRWGNFFNQEAFGTNTSLPWGMISPSTTAYLQAHQAGLAAEGVMVNPDLPVHPTFLYESLWCALGFLLLFLYRKKRKFNGEIALFYAIWYGIGRFFIEGLRTDSLMLHSVGLRVSQVVAATSVLVALVVWIAARIKTKGKPLVVPAIPDRTAKVKVQTETGQETVEISWPANTKEPRQEKKLEMAKEKLKQSAAERQEKDKANTKDKQQNKPQQDTDKKEQEEHPKGT